MQKLKHNKKRNTGLLYEFFARYIGKAILDNRDEHIAKAKTLLKKHFNKSTDIYKELKLVKALMESNISSREQAVHLINRVRDMVKYQSQARLELEKTSLIHEINSNLNADLFFEESIVNYKQLGTIQVLLNIWRDESLKESVVGETFSLEENLIAYMLENKSEDKTKMALSMTTEEIDKLVVNIMTEKVNKKYSNLNEEQKELIRLYVFSNDGPQAKDYLVEKLSAIKGKLLTTIPAHKHEFENDKVLIDKLNEVKNTMLSEYADFSSINDEMIGFYLGLSKLEHEVKSK